MGKILKIRARDILDSRGNPTVEVDVVLDNGVVSTASVPSGASTGSREALELRDGDKLRYSGKGVDKAVFNIKEKIAPKLVKMDIGDQEAIDKKMIALDGTEDKHNLGANAILGVSIAVAKAAAIDMKMPLYRYLGKLYGVEPKVLPVPMINVLNGGAHADNNIDFQEFMIMPVSAGNFREAMNMASSIFHQLNLIVSAMPRNISFGVGDEGGFAPIISGVKGAVAIIKETLNLIMTAIKNAGFVPGEDVVIALDPASSEFYNDGIYTLNGEKFTSEAMVDLYTGLVNEFPIKSIEDGMAENDKDGWKLLTQKIGDSIQLVGDDLFVTNIKILQDGIDNGLGNAILVKVNQIGSLSESIAAIKLAGENNYKSIISHRSGETEDTTIADLAVGCNAGQIKTGSMARADRVAKYNQLLRIEGDLQKNATYLGENCFGLKK